MMYCTSTVSLSMKTSSGTRLMVDLSSSLISMSTVHSCVVAVRLCDALLIFYRYLSVEGIELKLINTL